MLCALMDLIPTYLLKGRVIALDEKMDLLQICSAQKWCKFVQTGEEIWAKVVNAEFAYLFTPQCKRYAKSAFTTFAQIYSPVCTNLHHFWAEQI